MKSDRRWNIDARNPDAITSWTPGLFMKPKVFEGEIPGLPYDGPPGVGLPLCSPEELRVAIDRLNKKA